MEVLFLRQNHVDGNHCDQYSQSLYFFNNTSNNEEKSIIFYAVTDIADDWMGLFINVILLIS